MNGEGPSVPITTLAGIQSLTDLLIELPLPGPLPGTTGTHRSLLPHPQDADEAQRLLASPLDSFLVPQILDALGRTSLENVEIKDGYGGRNAHCGQSSQLLQYLVTHNPSVFGGLLPILQPQTPSPGSSTTVPAATPVQPPTPGSSPWMQNQFSPNAIYSQPPSSSSFSASHLSSGSPHSNSPQFPTQESPSYYEQCGGPLSVGAGHPVTVNTISSIAPNSTGLTNPSQPLTTHHPLNSLSYPVQQVSGVKSSLHNQAELKTDLKLSVSLGANSFSNNCSPETPSNPLDEKILFEPVAVKTERNQSLSTAIQPLFNSLSNGDCESNDKLFSSKDARTGNVYTSGSTNSSELISVQTSYCGININSSFPNKGHQNAAPVGVAAAVSTNELQKDLSSHATHGAEPSHRKVINSVLTVQQNDVTRHPESLHNSINDSIESQKAVAPFSGDAKTTVRRRSLNEPIVLLQKISKEDEVVAQRSVKQFKKTFGPALLHPGSEEEEPLAKVARIQGIKNCKVVLNDNIKKSSHANINNRKDANSVNLKKTDESKVLENNKQRSNKRGLDELANHMQPTKAKKARKTTRTSYAESSPSEDDLNDEDYNSEGDIEEKTPVHNFSMVERKTSLVKKAKKKLLEPEQSIEDLMDSNTYTKFTRVVDSITDSMEEIDFSTQLDENTECPGEALIPLFQLKELCNESAKMKMLKVMNQFPVDRLVRLLTILERNVLDGAKLLPVQLLDDQDEDEDKLWVELIMERLNRSVDSALICMYIMTSSDMSELIFLEDIIERVVTFVKFQLRNTVYPLFDPAYRVDPKSKDGYAGSIKQKRAHGSHKVRQKSIMHMYNKLHEIVSLLGELLDLQTMTDTIILQMSTLGVGPFFVEGVSELQLACLRLVTSIFAGYNKHRHLILEDILASIARLPTTKRSLRNYRLNSEENIQMLTALVLQLIHSVVQVPDSKKEKKAGNLISLSKEDKKIPSPEKNKDATSVETDTAVINSYAAAQTTALNFLAVFLQKCAAKHEDMDYRPLFENFVQDLLSTVNKPEWPASELLLSLLGYLLVQNFSTKSLDMSLRVASLDYLGVVAARLRKDAVSSQLKRDSINEVIQQIVQENMDEDEVSLSMLSTPKGKKSKQKPVKMEKKLPDENQILQKALLNYLDNNLHSDPTLIFARRFYVVQWYRDADVELKAAGTGHTKPSKDLDINISPPNSQPQTPPAKSGNGSKSSKPNSKHRKSLSSRINYEENDDDLEDKEETKEFDSESHVELYNQVKERKQFLLSLCDPISDRNSNLKNKTANSIDYPTAELVSRFLAAKRSFSQSFDMYLSQILKVLDESAVAVRTKAMKCLSQVVEADPGILARPDMKKGVHHRFSDQSTSVREAAVDLVGKFILIRPELTHQYYEMLTSRIVDTGVSVRKRVIKIFKDLCLEQPDFPKIPEICVMIIRRVNDEEGIKKLVGEVFQSMWFTPAPDKHTERILQKVKTITHVVSSCKEFGIEWFEQLLTNLLKAKDEANVRPVLKSCKQIVDCLVENVLRLEESSQEATSSDNLAASFTTLYLFSKIYPQLIVPHSTTIQPYLSITTSNDQQDQLIIQNVARILMKVVPMMDHPSETFLAQIEEDLVKLIFRNSPNVLQYCISCLGAVTNKVTLNYQLARDTFTKFFICILGFKKEHSENPGMELIPSNRARLMRSLITVGLFCMTFDYQAIDSCPKRGKDASWVFETIIYFTGCMEIEVRFKALTGLGWFLIRHYQFMMEPQVKALYHGLLEDPKAPAIMKCQVLKNLRLYLIEEEARLIQKDAEWSKNSKNEDLKEMDASSGMASTVIQLYLKQVLESVLSPQEVVRKTALQVIQMTLSQGLVHPVQIVPYLISLASEDDNVARASAEGLLQEIGKKYPGFVQMKALSGVLLSFKLQQILRGRSKELIRGYRITEQVPSSRNGFLYTVIRGTRQNRRAFIISLLKRFDEQSHSSLDEMFYLADNMAYFPYQAQDEPLFIIHHIDVMLSVTGSNLLQTFREHLLPKFKPKIESFPEEMRAKAEPPLINEAVSQTIKPAMAQPLLSHPPEEDDEDEDDFESICSRLPRDTAALQECITSSQGCVLLLFLKQTLKDMYGFTDCKIQQYSPNEANKVYEKALNRKSGVGFKPNAVLDFAQQQSQVDLSLPLCDKGRDALVNHYLNFKQLMLTIDPVDDDEAGEGGKKAPTTAAVLRTFSGAASATLDTTRTKVDNEAVCGDKAAEGRLGSSGGDNPLNVSGDKTMTPKSTKSPSSSHSRSRSKHKTKIGSATKEKVKKKHKKKRRRILSDESENDGDSDPDYE